MPIRFTVLRKPTLSLLARLVVITSLLIAAGPSLLGQLAPSLRGTLQDATGASISGSRLELDTAAGLIVTETTSNEAGSFVFSSVTPGSYTLVVPAANGFAELRTPIQLPAPTAFLHLVLQPDTIAQAVDVSSGAQLSTDASENKDAVTVKGSELNALPVFDQNYIATLLPFLDASSMSSGGVTIVVDGVEMKSAGVSPSAIQEVRINTDPYSAESNRPGRGRIEIMTKPGTPNYHGELNFLLRDSALDASNYFAPVKPPEHRRIYEGHFTGPAGRGGHSTFLVTGARREDDLQAAVHAFGHNGLIALNSPTPTRETEFTGRLAHDFSSEHRASVQYNFDQNLVTNGNVGGLVLPEAGFTHDAREDDIVINDRLILTPRLLNQLQITLEKDEDVYKSETNAPSIHVSQSFQGGGAQYELSLTESTLHINDVLSWTHGRHYVRFGPQLPQLSRRAIDDHTNRLGTFSFSSIDAYANASPFVFTGQQGIGRSVFWFNEMGSFIQDQIKLTPDLQVSLGLRYDWQTYLSDNNNIAPRVSAAWSPAGSKKTVLRLGSGVFFDRTNGPTIADAKVHDGTILRSVQILDPGYPSPLPAGSSYLTQPTSLVRFDPAIHTPYLLQYSFGMEQQLSSRLTVSAGYRGQVGDSLLRSRDTNAPLPPFYSTRPDAMLSSVQQFEAHGRGLQNALDLSFQGSFGPLFSGRAQYTLARNCNNTSGVAFFPQDQSAPQAEWGRADTDRLHRLNLLGTILPDHWLSLGIALALYSGAPYTEITGDDNFHTGLGNARPTGVGRNTLQGGGTANLDLSWRHEVRLSRDADKPRSLTSSLSVFNVLNRANFGSYVGSLQSPLFGQPTTALPGRQLQLALGYAF